MLTASCGRNVGAQRLTGYSADEAIGHNPRILKSGETPSEQYAELWQIISNGGNWHGEFHNRKKSGELYWESASIAPIKDDQGRILRYLAVKEDITLRKTYEAELLKNTEELLLKHNELNALFSLVNSGKREWEDTMDSIPEMVLMCDPGGAVTRCNRAVTVFTGLSYNQILGLGCLEQLERLEAVHAGHHHVEQHDVGRIALLDRRQQLVAARVGARLIAAEREEGAQVIRERGIVIHDGDVGFLQRFNSLGGTK